MRNGYCPWILTAGVQGNDLTMVKQLVMTKLGLKPSSPHSAFGWLPNGCYIIPFKVIYRARQK